MAIGDDAILAGMANVDGATTLANTLDTEIMRTRDYVANGTAFWKPGVTCPVTKGGTGATNGAAARVNLDVPRTGTAGGRAVMDITGAGNIGLRFGGTRFVGRTGSTELEIANLTDLAGLASTGYVNDAVSSVDLSSRVAKSGDTMSGHLYLPASVGATSGFTVAYINGDGRVSRGTSSERFKKHISPIGASVLGDIFPELFRFQMRQGDGSWKFGYIAERLAESEALRPFVVWETVTELDDAGKVTGSHLALDEAGHPIPLSIDFIGLLLAQVAQLHVRVAALEAQR